MNTSPIGPQALAPAITPPVTGGGGAGVSPEIRTALEALTAAVGSLSAALQGAQAIAGGGAAGGGAAGGGAAGGCGCGCGAAQATAGAADLGTTGPNQYRGASGAPDASAQRPKPAKDSPAKPKADKPAEAGAGSAPAGTKLVDPLPGAKLTSPFGDVSAIRNNRPHGGLDLAKPSGTPISAAAAGKVVEVKYDAKGYGNYVTIDHGNGRYTRYAHMVERSPLKVGDTVAAGDQVGKVGSTGNSTGPHVHFEVLTGGMGASNRVDPAPYLSGDKKL